MTLATYEPLKDEEVARLVQFIRDEEDNEYVAQLCAEISSEGSRIAKYLSKVGLSLSADWKNANHMVVAIKDGKARLSAVHVRATGEHHNQVVEVTHAIGRRRETAKETFSLPHEFVEAREHVLHEVFALLPKDRLVVKVAGEYVSLFEAATKPELHTWDEGALKQIAMEAASHHPDAPMIRTPYAPDAPMRSFAR